ncbi:uncharacterized protein LOC130933883 [Arachis stenosperma]|uniref:uncharacterized protein LOC130933883 n=1 Tax=Arachis stenosperma TaxID=217475 RepID=UPI0025AD90AA|nr:uncharacterized protein LOC130933883 [Arachis stenosperma]
MRHEGVLGHAVDSELDAERSTGLTEFQVGQQFQDKDEALLSVKTYSIGEGYSTGGGVRSPPVCGQVFRVWEWVHMVDSASLRKRKGIWEVKRADASVSIKVLLTPRQHFGFKPTYWRVWMAKQKSIALIYGDWDESYNDLPRWVLGVHDDAWECCGPKDEPGSSWRTGEVWGNVAHRDCTGWELQHSTCGIRTSRGENAESWTFFLSHLRQHVTLQPGLLVISDRHNGIKAALEAPDGGWLPPSAYRVFCIRHVAANFALTFKAKTLGGY